MPLGSVGGGCESGWTQELFGGHRTGLAHGLDVNVQGRQAKGSSLIVGWRGHWLDKGADTSLTHPD